MFWVILGVIINKINIWSFENMWIIFFMTLLFNIKTKKKNKIVKSFHKNFSIKNFLKVEKFLTNFILFRVFKMIFKESKWFKANIKLRYFWFESKKTIARNQKLA